MTGISDDRGGAGVGSYVNVLQAILRVIATEPVTRTLTTRWTDVNPALLIAVSLFHTVAAGKLAREVASHPDRLMDDAWVRRRCRQHLARYLLFPLVSRRQTFWRQPNQDCAFWFQSWVPIALRGAALQPPNAVLTSAAYGLASSLLAGWANGEPLLPPAPVRYRMLTYSVAALVAGIFTGSMATILRDAREQVVAAGREAATLEALVREADAYARRREAWVESVHEVERAARQVLPELDAEGLIGHLRTSLATLPAALGALVEPPARDFETIVHKQATVYGLKATVTTHEPTPPSDHSLTLAGVVVAGGLRNVRVHSGCDEVSVRLTHGPDLATLEIRDRGPGVGSPPPELAPDHALGHARAVLQELDGDLVLANATGGGTQLIATWSLK